MPRRTVSVLILYNQPLQSDGKGSPAFVESQAGVLDEVRAVAEACRALCVSYDTGLVRRFDDVAEVLAGSDHDVVFNLVEGFEHQPELACHVPSLAAAFGKACTGNETPGLLLSLDKGVSKAVLRAAGLPCPAGVVVEPGQSVRRSSLFDGPYIVKPLSADASEGIDNAAIVRSKGPRLTAAVARVHEQFAQAALVEQFIEGRELNISVISRNGRAEVLPPAEIDFSAFGPDQPRIVGYDAKWRSDSFEYNNTPRIIPAPLSRRLAAEIRRLAPAACKALGCTDYCRVDFRVDRSNRPFIIEVNANPDISPDAGFAAALSAAGIAYRQFVRLAIDNALARRAQAMPRKPKAGRKAAAVAAPGSTGESAAIIRRPRASDRGAVMAFLARSRLFRPGELDVAREVFDEALTAGPQGHYQSFVVESDGQTLGWVCWGPTPCTVATCDLYWIAVAPEARQRGLGRALIAFAERGIAAAGKSLVVVETSGRPAYEPARAFYAAVGYEPAATIADFYGPGDPKLIFTKRLSATGG
ncbi:MAG TPA: GNAT family N-acetyltransferase [Phycisphaerales bacterium]|nr:GNAT family N-acetyltransferase [Phycisphaerales bacterium]